MSLIADSVRVSWIDMCFIRRNIPSILVTCLVAPLLYLVAFGYGLGKGMTVDGFPYIAFMIPGVMALTTLTSSFNTVATKVMVQRVYYQSFDELILCSMSPTAIALGKAYAGAVRGVISCMILYILGLAICPEMSLSLWVPVLVVVSSMVYSLLGVVSGMLANSNLTLTLFTSLVIMPMTFLCGTLFSLDAMPPAVSAVIGVLPLTHTTECMRAAVLGTAFPWVSLAVMLVYGVAFLLVARYVIERGKS
ncbi:MAG: ABC transporter permease [Candidatus Methanomethylophilaceae archaeon]|nr:ABC transporter permease [Candidatus Methanomethylophilaceae archaeon]